MRVQPARVVGRVLDLEQGPLEAGHVGDVREGSQRPQFAQELREFAAEAAQVARRNRERPQVLARRLAEETDVDEPADHRIDHGQRIAQRGMRAAAIDVEARVGRNAAGLLVARRPRLGFVGEALGKGQL